MRSAKLGNHLNNYYGLLTQSQLEGSETPGIAYIDVDKKQAKNYIALVRGWVTTQREVRRN